MIRRSLLVVGVLILAVVGCNSGSANPSPASVTNLTVGLGYIPSVQFAPFYRAQQQGYYRNQLFMGAQYTF